MESWEYPGLARVYACLFTGVRNSSALRSRLVNAASLLGEEGELEREAVNFSFIDAAAIMDLTHLQTAALQAVLALHNNTLRTKTVHSEILFALNPSNNITESIRRFGLSNTTSATILVRTDDWSSPIEDRIHIYNRMESLVQGELVPFARLDEVTDWSLVLKYYKINKRHSTASNSIGVKTVMDVGDDMLDRKLSREIVISTVATKMIM